MNEVVKTEFIRFLEIVPASRLQENLLRMLIYYMEYKRKHREALPDFMDDLLGDLKGLFELLDVIEREVDQSGIGGQEPGVWWWE